jgi:hypothetical protein
MILIISLSKVLSQTYISINQMFLSSYLILMMNSVYSIYYIKSILFNHLIHIYQICYYFVIIYILIQVLLIN